MPATADASKTLEPTRATNPPRIVGSTATFSRTFPFSLAQAMKG